MFLTFDLVIMIAFVVLYYRIGESEYDAGLLISGLSLILWVAGIYLFHFGKLSSILVQIGLFFGLTFWNMARKRW